MDATELGVLFGGIASILGVLVYFTKHIRKSECCGSKCQQVVVDNNGKVISSRDSILPMPLPAPDPHLVREIRV